MKIIAETRDKIKLIIFPLAQRYMCTVVRMSINSCLSIYLSCPSEVQRSALRLLTQPTQHDMKGKPTCARV